MSTYNPRGTEADTGGVHPDLLAGTRKVNYADDILRRSQSNVRNIENWIREETEFISTIAPLV
jgi:hypothetical protein